MKISNYQNHQSEEQETTGKKKKSVVLLTVTIIILVLLCLCLRSCRRARDEPAPLPAPDRTYETDWQNPIKDELIPSQDNQRLNLIIADCYRISEEEKSFYIRYPEENIFDVMFTIRDSAGNELYQTAYVAPGTNVAIDIYDRLPKGDFSVDCLVSIYDHETSAMISNCTTLVLNIINE